MQELFYGRVVDLVRRTAGSPLAANAGIADTVLSLESTDDFNETGGTVRIGVDEYAYSAVDFDANAVTLDTGLLTAAVADDLVEIVDDELGTVDVEYVAHVMLEDQDPGDEPIEVTVQHSLVNMLAESVRGGASESVTLIRDGEDDFLIFQVDGKLAVDIALEERVNPIEQDLIELNLDLDELNNVTLPGVQSDLAGLQGKFPITSTDISNSAITTPKLAANSVEASKIVAFTITGDKIAANTISGDKIIANTIGGDKIVGNSITGDKIQANAITADKIAANAITSTKLSADAIDGKVITGPTVQTNTGLPRLELNTNGLSAKNASGIEKFSVDRNGSAYFNGPSFTVETRLDCYGIQSQGTIQAFGDVKGYSLYSTSPTTTTAAANVNIGPAGQIREVTSSAAKYKENIADAEIDLDAVLAIQPRTYTYREDYCEDTSEQVGLIADELAALGLAPWVVYEDGEIESVDYPKLTVPLIALCKRQQTQIDEQAATIAALSARLDALEGLHP